MLAYIRSHWHTISTGLLAVSLLGAGGSELVRVLRGDCCYPGSPCCHPGSPCCHHAARGSTPAATPPRESAPAPAPAR
jgi:hypothetical protein